MLILLLGDAHGCWWRVTDAIEDAVRRHGIGAAIQVGDFGFYAKVMGSLLSRPQPRLPVPLHVIDGNHEDHALLARLRASGELAGWARDHDLHVRARGDVAEIGGRAIGFCGGALNADRAQQGSIDKGTTNWLTDRQADAAVQAFDAAGVDVVVTHSCPHSIGIGMRGSVELIIDVERHCRAKGFDTGPFEDCGEPALTRLWTRLRRRPRTWVFGHFHRHRHARVLETDFHCIGCVDGSDDRERAVTYLLDTASGEVRCEAD